MAIALVGSAGAVSSASAATISPAFGQSTTAGNLLIACINSKGASAGAITTAASGWSQAVQDGATQFAAIWYKPNCGSGETAPTFTSSSATRMYAVLSEWSGAATTSPVDQTGSSAINVSNPAVIAASGNDTNANNLAVSVSACNLSVAAVTTFSASWAPASGSASILGVFNTSQAFHFSAQAYLLNGHGGGAADTNTETETGGTITGYNWAIATFLPGGTAVALTAASAPSAAVAATNTEAVAVTGASSPSAAIAATNTEKVAVTAASAPSAAVAGTNAQVVQLTCAVSSSAAVAVTNTEKVAITAAVAPSSAIAGTNAESVAITSASSPSAVVSAVNSTGTVQITCPLTAAGAVAATSSEAVTLTGAIAAIAAVVGVNTEAVAINAESDGVASIAATDTVAVALICAVSASAVVAIFYGNPNLRAIRGTVVDFTGTPIVGTAVVVGLGTSIFAITASQAIAPATITTLTDGSGVYYLTLFITSLLTPAIPYILTIGAETHALTVPSGPYPAGHPTYFDVVLDGLISS